MQFLNVRAVLFDLGDTLIHGNFTAGATEAVWHQIYHRLINPSGDPNAPGLAVLRAAMQEHVQSAMALTWRDKSEQEIEFLPLIRRAFQAANFPQAEDEAFLRQVVALEHQLLYEQIVMVAPQAIETLQELKRRGYRLGLVSNFCNLPDVAYENIRRVRLLEQFDASVLSCEVGWRKPSPHIYAAICHRLAVSAEACLFVGDRLIEDVRGPQKFGMQAVQSRQFRQEDADPAIRPDAIIDTLDQMLDLLP